MRRGTRGRHRGNARGSRGSRVNESDSILGEMGHLFVYVLVIPPLVLGAFSIIGFLALLFFTSLTTLLLFVFLLLLGYMLSRVVHVLGYAAAVLMVDSRRKGESPRLASDAAMKRARNFTGELVKLSFLSHFNFITSSFGYFYDIPLVTPHLVLGKTSVGGAVARIKTYLDEFTDATGTLEARSRAFGRRTLGMGRWHYRFAIYHELHIPTSVILVHVFFGIFFIVVWTLVSVSLFLCCMVGFLIASFYVRVRMIECYLDFYENCRPAESIAERVAHHIETRPGWSDRGTIGTSADAGAQAPDDIAYLQCPECGQLFEEGHTSCPGCGVQFAVDQDADKVIHTENIAVCPQCGFFNPLGSRQCDICATWLVER